MFLKRAIMIQKKDREKSKTKNKCAALKKTKVIP